MEVIFFQWFFIEIYPSKIIAKLGPARFLSFNLVVYVILFISTLSEFIPKLNFKKFYYYEKKKNNKYFNLNSTIASLFILILITSTTHDKNNISGLNLTKNSKYEIEYNNNKLELLENLKSINSNTIFNSFLPGITISIRSLNGQNIYYDQVFPFNEKYIKTWDKRRKENKILEKVLNINPEEFVRLSYDNKIDI